MSEWWTYRLSDFLMFSPGTYWRLVERYNRDVWPLQLLMIAVGAMALWSAARTPVAARAVAAVLAPVWFWVGWAFHWQRYAPINWAAEYFAMAFALQALLLVASAMMRAGDGQLTRPFVRACGLALGAIGMFFYPLIAPAVGRPWSQSEVFGVMPGPTAMATLGLLLLVDQPRRRWLAVIPALSLLAELATRWTFQG